MVLILFFPNRLEKRLKCLVFNIIFTKIYWLFVKFKLLLGSDVWYAIFLYFRFCDVNRKQDILKTAEKPVQYQKVP